MSQKSHKSSIDKPPIYVGEIIPKKYDYSEDKVVSHIKNQQSCRSGYALSAVGAIESAFSLVNSKIPALREQEIMGCTKKFKNFGCQG
ncbi:hypothetical protein MXB_4126, partial [Myxobolus squamalis]